MNKYIGTKQVAAQPMTRSDAEAHLGRNVGGDKHGDGYLVEYEGGYQAWSPKDVFDAAYRPTTGMTFGLAIEALKTGQRLARAGWNGKGMWVEYVSVKDFSFSELTPHFVIKNTKNSFSAWVPSINDCLADDWQIVQ